MAKNNDLFTTMPVGKAIAKLTIPTVISQIIVILYSLADTFFIGKIGDPNQITALSIVFPIYTLLTAIANLFGIGANSIISRSLSKSDVKTIKQASSFAFYGSIIVTLICCVLLASLMYPILNFFGADEYTLSYTADYLLWVFVIGGIPTVAGLVLGHLVRAIGKTKEAGFGLALGGVLNIILDPIFILVFNMEIAGAGLATMLSNVISLIFFLVILIKIKKTSSLSINPKNFSFRKEISWGTISIGFPAALSVLLVCVSIAVLNGLLLKYPNGNILSAAYGVTSKCGTIALHISIGIAQGVMPLIGYSYGAKDHKRVHDVCRLSFIILLIFSVIFLIIVQFIPGPIVKLFIDHEETIEVGSVFMRYWSWCVIGMSLFNMYNSIFQAVGRWKTSLFLTVLRLGVIFIALSFLLDYLFGVTGLMWVQAITDTLSCIIAMIMYYLFKKSLTKSHDEVVKNDALPEIEHENYIIAISRQFGSGGRTIGKEVAKQLNIPCYDSELIEKIAKETGFSEDYIENNETFAQSTSLYFNAKNSRDYNGVSDLDKLWLAQKKIILELANKGPCVIVGRCADYILKDNDKCIKIFVYASKEDRMKRIVDVYGQKEESPKKRLEDKDKKRKAYYELYTSTEWGDTLNYDFSLNSGKLGIDTCVKLITKYYQEATKNHIKA